LSWSTCARGANKPGLRELLGQFDAFLLAGGNPYYLRSLIRITGADELITERVRDGAIYAGASAAAVVAGPTLRHFDELDSPDEAEEVIWSARPDPAELAICAPRGLTVQRLTDAQALVIDGTSSA
jgi:hypothetical protein